MRHDFVLPSFWTRAVRTWADAEDQEPRTERYHRRSTFHGLAQHSTGIGHFPLQFLDAFFEFKRLGLAIAQNLHVGGVLLEACQLQQGRLCVEHNFDPRHADR